MALLFAFLFGFVGVGFASAQDDDMQASVCSDGTIEQAMNYPAISKVQKPFKGTGDPADSEGVIEFSPGDPDLLVPRRVPTPKGPPIETVLGWDTRMRVYPSATMPTKATALILFSQGSSGYMCTGWLYGADVVATAGHCVHGGSGSSWSTDVKVYPAYDGSSAPYGYCTAKWLASVVGWTSSSDERYDYGAIKLNCSVGNTTGWFGFYAPSKPSGAVTINGYPADKTLYEQWLSVDQVLASDTYQIYYKNDTYGGMSGSAVWSDRDGTQGPYGIGIHAYGPHGSSNHKKYNHGTRITLISLKLDRAFRIIQASLI